MTEIEKAKKVLRDAGYFTDNLWHVSDVQQDFKCTDEEAQEILREALTNAWVMSEAISTIREYASQDYEPINEED